MIQFIVMVVLNFIDNAVIGSIGTCHDATSTYDCVSGIGINVLYVIILAGWFAFVWILAYAAQDRRDRRLAAILMGAELMILAIALFNAKHYPNIAGLITSVADAAFAIWVMILAFRIVRSKGGRITAGSSRARRRPAATKAPE